MKKLIKPLVITVLCLIVIVAGAVYYLTPNTLEVVVVGRLTVSPELMGTGKVEGDRRIVILIVAETVSDVHFTSACPHHPAKPLVSTPFSLI